MKYINGLPVLEPDLDHPHVQPGVRGQLLPHVPRRLGAGLVSLLQDLSAILSTLLLIFSIFNKACLTSIWRAVMVVRGRLFPSTPSP